MSASQPKKIGHYLIKEEVIPAGLGRLFLGSLTPQGELFALRQLPDGYLDNPQWRDLFTQELHALEACETPAIIPTRLEEIEERDYLVRRWLPGNTLADWLRNGPLSTELVLPIITQIANALDAAHVCGVLHRELKPSNVVFYHNGAACLVDFGLVQRGKLDLTDALSDLKQTTGALSPETALGKGALDVRSEVYTLGALAFEMLAGGPPYPRNDLLREGLDHLNAPLPDLKALRPELPLGLVQTIQRAMAKDPAQRFASAGELAQALEWAAQNPKRSPEWLKGMTGMNVERNRSSRNSHKRGTVWVWIILLLVALTAMLSVTGTWGRLMPKLNLAFLNLPVQAVPVNLTPIPSTIPATETAILAPTNTAVPSETQSLTTPSPQPVTESVAPSATAPSLPSETPTVPPPVTGGADLLAFINENDIWSVNLDGSNLTRLTEDGLAKVDLQWTPDGKALTYSSNGCYYLLTYVNLKATKIGCFADLEIAPDMQRFIIGDTVTLPDTNKSWMNFLGQLDYIYLSSLTTIPQQSSSNGMAFIGGRLNQFSSYSERMAAVFKAPVDGRQVDLIQVFELTSGGEIDVLDTFPAQRFIMSGYSGQSDQPVLDDFGWNGEELFTLHGNVLHGYGDLVMYNMNTGRAEKLNPILGRCCYQDIQFSPDGQYLLFAFQDNSIGQGAQIYLIPLGTIGSGASYTPIVLPYYFFGDSRARVEPALRPGN